MAKTYNLFLSHSWRHGAQYDRLANLLQERGYFPWNDFSVPRNHPIHTNGTDKQLYEAISNKIRLCHVVLILAGVYATYSKWIDKEIQIATVDFDKPIIGVKPRAQINFSAKVQNAAVALVGWNTESVVDAIRHWG